MPARRVQRLNHVFQKKAPACAVATRVKDFYFADRAGYARVL